MKNILFRDAAMTLLRHSSVCGRSQSELRFQSR